MLIDLHQAATCLAVASMDMDMEAASAFYFAMGALAVAVSGAVLYRDLGLLLNAASGGAKKLASSANRLLLFGYTFLMTGYLILSLPTGKDGLDYAGVLDLFRWKFGVLALVLGVGHLAGLVACSFVCGSALRRTSEKVGETA